MTSFDKGICVAASPRHMKTPQPRWRQTIVSCYIDSCFLFDLYCEVSRYSHGDHSERPPCQFLGRNRSLKWRLSQPPAMQLAHRALGSRRFFRQCHPSGVADKGACRILTFQAPPTGPCRIPQDPRAHSAHQSSQYQYRQMLNRTDAVDSSLTLWYHTIVF